MPDELRLERHGFAQERPRRAQQGLVSAAARQPELVVQSRSVDRERPRRHADGVELVAQRGARDLPGRRSSAGDLRRGMLAQCRDRCRKGFTSFLGRRKEIRRVLNVSITAP